MRRVPLECDINIAANGPFWLEVTNPEHPFTAMLISHSRGTCILSLLFLTHAMKTIDERAESCYKLVMAGPRCSQGYSIQIRCSTINNFRGAGRGVILAHSFTGVVRETSYRKWRETKHQPGRASCSQQLGCRSISLHFL